MDKLLRVPNVSKPKRHSVGSEPYPEGFWKSHLHQLKQKQLIIATNKAITERTKYEAQIALQAHNKKIKKKQILLEANIRLRHRFPESFSWS